MTLTNLLLPAGKRSDGSTVEEEVLVERLSPSRYRLRKSPGLVLGLAAGDTFDFDDHGIHVVERGGNICVQVFVDEDRAKARQALDAKLRELGGWLDGESEGQLVYSVPVECGFPALEAALSSATSGLLAEWYYGNVYDPADGVTPLDWWKR